VAPIRRDFGERGENEPTLVQPRVRQDERRRLHHLAPMIEKIEVEDTRRICCAANTAKPRLDSLHHSEHVARPELSRIFVCGGLGPTPDDRTYVALARALNQPLVYRREVGSQMQNLMFILNMAARRGTAELNAGNRKMAMLPKDAILVRNGAGMAPGLAFELGQGRYLFALPGVPHELRAVYEDIERLYLTGERADVVRELHYRMAPESMFHDVMQTLETEYPDVSLGSYPQTETRELILRASGPDAARVEAVIAAIRERVKNYQPVA